MTKDLFDNIKAIIFDMDGTLIDSMWIWKQIDIDFFKMFDFDFPGDMQKEIEGMSFYQTAVYFKERYNFPITVEEMIDIWNEMAHEKYANEVFLKPGAKKFLEYCKSHNIKLGIATSNSRFLFDAVREHLNLDEYFDCMLTGTEITNGKPAPDVFLTVASRLQINPEDCLVFEDIIPGIMAGHNANMKVVAIADLYSANDEEQKREMADYFINDYYDVLNILNN